MEFRHLLYFIAVAEELNFSRAARRLNISQPPLSQQILQLEGNIGVKLLKRTKRRVELTPAGAVFLEDARRIVAMSADAVQRSIRTDRGEIGRLAVGYVGSANYSILPQVIREFRKRFSNIELSLAELNTSQQIDSLRDGRIHVGFMRPAKGIEEENLNTEIVFREPLVVAMPHTHHLKRRASVPLALLAKEPFIMIPRHRGPGYFDHLIVLCQKEGFSPKIVLEASQFHTIIGMVAAGIGLSVVPASMQRSRMKGVIFKKLDGGAETVLTMVWDRNDESPVLQKFIAVVREKRGN